MYQMGFTYGYIRILEFQNEEHHQYTLEIKLPFWPWITWEAGVYSALLASKDEACKISGAPELALPPLPTQQFRHLTKMEPAAWTNILRQLLYCWWFSKKCSSSLLEWKMWGRTPLHPIAILAVPNFQGSDNCSYSFNSTSGGELPLNHIKSDHYVS